MTCVVFRSDAATNDTAAGPPGGYRFELWTPALTRVTPSGVPRVAYTVWWAFHELRVFENRDYAVLLCRYGHEIVHYLGIFPPYFRFPFIRAQDLQIGDVWTDPRHRGKGLASYGITAAIRARAAPGRRFWYVVADDNVPSIRAAERAGLKRVGNAERTTRFGVRVLGTFELHEEERVDAVGSANPRNPSQKPWAARNG